MAKTYKQLMRQAERERLEITAEDRKRITAIFTAAAAMYSHRIWFRGRSLTTAAVMDAARELRGESKDIRTQ